ncbi:alpha/beta fold hydrolase [Rhizobium sp. AAP43]|uniref:alpha/beta fold hydrolase n=1 Tax=Rhizobium sp. AAP43 TaxID=1523420 RepID=UPI0006B92F97|nr:alpha/beta hydrolase [Rhizobium sp. AAP43]KPF45040.1 alpha/beta hydrolase [Rhizobium sp. AAP43]
MKLSPPQPEWISAQAGGKDFVFIHGMVMAPSFWATYAPEVARQGRAAAYPLPGHHPWQLPAPGIHFDAKAVADAYAEAIRRDFDGRSVTLIGHSTGGFVSLLIAMHHPDLVHAVILMGAFACGRFEGQERLPAKLLRIPKVGPFLFRQFFLRWISTQEQFRWGSLECVFDRACPWQDERAVAAMEGVRKDLLRARPEDIAACIRFMSSTTLLHGLTTIPAPVLNIVGANDAIVPPAHQLRVSKLLPQTQTVILSNCGHLPMVEHQRQTERIIETFVRSLEIRSKPAIRETHLSTASVWARLGLSALAKQPFDAMEQKNRARVDPAHEVSFTKSKERAINVYNSHRNFDSVADRGTSELGS